MALILSFTGTICLLLMAVTLGIQGLRDAMVFAGMLFAIVFVWLIVNYIMVKKVDPELSMEVARLLFPSGAFLSIILSTVLGMYLDAMIPGDEGRQHYILIFAGVGVGLFLVVRCLDIKWLRGEEEILLLEQRGK